MAENERRALIAAAAGKTMARRRWTAWMVSVLEAYGLSVLGTPVISVDDRSDRFVADRSQQEQAGWLT